MEKFSYGVEFYKRNLFNIEDKIFHEKVREAEKLERMFLEKNGNVDIIRENIIISYYLNKEIKLKYRYQYIRGLIYSRQYIDYKDVDNFRDEVEKEFEANNITDTLFSIKTCRTPFDDSLFENYLSNPKDNDDLEKEAEDIRKIIENDLNNSQNKKSTEVLELDDSNEDEEYPTVYEANSLTCYEKIEMFDEQFETYLKGILSKKQIDDLTKKEQEMIYKGAYDWFNKMMKELRDIYNYQEQNGKYNSRNLTLNI